MKYVQNAMPIDFHGSYTAELFAPQIERINKRISTLISTDRAQWDKAVMLSIYGLKEM